MSSKYVGVVYFPNDPDERLRHEVAVRESIDGQERYRLFDGSLVPLDANIISVMVVNVLPFVNSQFWTDLVPGQIYQIRYVPYYQYKPYTFRDEIPEDDIKKCFVLSIPSTPTRCTLVDVFSGYKLNVQKDLVIDAVPAHFIPEDVFNDIQSDPSYKDRLF